MKRCPECFLLLPTGASVCGCGYEFQSEPRETRHVDGELVPLTAATVKPPRNWLDPAMEPEYQRLSNIRSERGYKPAWVGLQLAHRFGPRAWAYAANRQKQIEQDSLAPLFRAVQ